MSGWKTDQNCLSHQGSPKIVEVTLELFQTHQRPFSIEIFLRSILFVGIFHYFPLWELSIIPYFSPDDLAQLFPHKQECRIKKAS